MRTNRARLGSFIARVTASIAVAGWALVVGATSSGVARVDAPSTFGAAHLQAESHPFTPALPSSALSNARWASHSGGRTLRPSGWTLSLSRTLPPTRWLDSRFAALRSTVSVLDCQADLARVKTGLDSHNSTAVPPPLA